MALIRAQQRTSTGRSKNSVHYSVIISDNLMIISVRTVYSYATLAMWKKLSESQKFREQGRTCIRCDTRRTFSCGGSRYSCKALRPRSAAMTHVRRAGRQSYRYRVYQKHPAAPHTTTYLRCLRVTPGNVMGMYTLECFVVGGRSNVRVVSAHTGTFP